MAACRTQQNCPRGGIALADELPKESTGNTTDPIVGQRNPCKRDRIRLSHRGKAATPPVPFGTERVLRASHVIAKSQPLQDPLTYARERCMAH